MRNWGERMEVNTKVLVSLAILPFLMIGYYIIHLVPLLSGNGIALRTTSQHSQNYNYLNDVILSAKYPSVYLNAPHKRCPLFGSRQMVNYGKNLYTTKPFSHEYATPFEATQHLPAFMKEFTPPTCFRVMAIMAGFNEADVLHSSITDLIRQDIDVHFIDNWSTDDTAVTIRRLQRTYPGKITSEKFPVVDSRLYNWASLLERKTEIARYVQADWVIHIDPDELRESPWGAEVSLRRALYVADQLEFNVVNFGNVLVFHPLESTNFTRRSSLRQSFLHYSKNQFSGDSKQSKAWKTYYSACDKRELFSPPVVADLASSGGHIVQYIKSKRTHFPGHQLFPYTFILRHYPIRSQEHGMRKVFAERTSRWNESEREKLDWHKQYDTLRQGHNFLGEERALFRAHDNGDLPAGLLSAHLPCRRQ